MLMNEPIKIATAHDVARLAGVSMSAVSRTFTPGASVSPKMRARVLEAAESLQYLPNLVARSLSTQRSGTIGLVMGDIRNPYYAEAVDDLTRRLATVGFRVMFTSVWGSVTVDDVAPGILQSRMDGVIIASIDEADRLGEMCFRAGAGVVLFNRSSKTSDVLSSVRSDNVEGGRAVANFIVDRGYARPAFIAGVEHISTSQEREQGLVGRLVERGLPIVARDVGAYTYEGGYECAVRFAAMTDVPDVIFCANDIMAIGAIDGLRSVGLRVGYDVAVIGFDDIAAAAWPPYDLTTVRQDKTAMIEAAVRTLLRQIRTGDRTRHTQLVPVELIERGSTQRSPSPQK